MATKTEIRHQAADLLDDLVVLGTATSGATTYIIDTNNLIFADDDQLNGYEVYVYEGVNAGTARIITDFVSADKKIIFPAMGSACDTTTKYEIHRKIRYAKYTRAIDLALNAMNAALGRDKFDYYVDKVDETIILNDLLMGAGDFERWPSGASSAPDDFSIDGNSSVARESTIVDKGLYSAKLTNAVSNVGYLQWTYAQYLKYAEKSFTLRGKFYSATASRVRALLTDGVNSEYSDYHSGGSGYEHFEVEDFEVDDSPTMLKIQLRTETGSQIAAYWDAVRLISASNIYEYNLPVYPAPFATIGEIWMESGEETDDNAAVPQFNYQIPLSVVRVIKQPVPKLFLDPRYFTPTAGRRLRIIGQSKAQVSREHKDDFIIAYVCWYCAAQLTNSEEMLAKAQLWRDEKDSLLGLMLLEKEELREKVDTESRALTGAILIDR